MKKYVKAIKKIVPMRMKLGLRLLFVSSSDPNWMQYRSVDNIRIFVFLAGFYQNLGDMAITYAQVSFLKDAFPKATIICVPSVQTYSSIKTIKTYIRNEDIITIAGGGNMDDNYPSLESARLYVVKSFPDQRIISFPQTIFFSESRLGRKRAIKSKKIYQKHQSLTIFAREPASLIRGKRLFPGVDVQLVPDIVLSLELSQPSEIKRKNILFCCRNDKERLNEKGFNDRVLYALQERFGNVIIRDTVDVKLSECTQEKYEATIESFLDLIRSCKAVVTDRLHCMLFCVITKTPCVAMDNTNHKISEVFSAWLKDVPYIKLVENQDSQDILATIELIMHQEYSGCVLNLEKHFEPLRRALHE